MSEVAQQREMRIISGTVPRYASPPDGEFVAQVLRIVGLYPLGGGDGCLCAHLYICGLSVDVNCRKSDGGKPAGFWGTMLRVHSGSLSVAMQELEVVAKECIRQLKEDDETPVILRYCDYESDNLRKCIYCSKPREPLEYLCAKCKVGQPSYDYTLIQFQLHEITE